MSIIINIIIISPQVALGRGGAWPGRRLALDGVEDGDDFKFVSAVAKSRLLFPIAIEQKLIGTSIHLDSSSLSVHGEYTEEDKGGIKLSDDNESVLETLVATPSITHGFSKDHRPDLKRLCSEG